ncbi:unnamed protein product [Didymodactylos carnosus]|uniref:Uncharacterized protein n=1 Tax=Didymodactylos carnosus TaxID=1234261 RepID=A0A814NQZ1_9BILA|nr:unnamed protein product [Didymodactylos carnosus]CAF3860759.1 unnamed protein product [Didymodactylos carnosus]
MGGDQSCLRNSTHSENTLIYSDAMNVVHSHKTKKVHFFDISKSTTRQQLDGLDRNDDYLEAIETLTSDSQNNASTTEENDVITNKNNEYITYLKTKYKIESKSTKPSTFGKKMRYIKNWLYRTIPLRKDYSEITGRPIRLATKPAIDVIPTRVSEDELTFPIKIDNKVEKSKSTTTTIVELMTITTSQKSSSNNNDEEVEEESESEEEIFQSDKEQEISSRKLEETEEMIEKFLVPQHYCSVSEILMKSSNISVNYFAPKYNKQKCYYQRVTDPCKLIVESNNALPTTVSAFEKKCTKLSQKSRNNSDLTSKSSSNSIVSSSLSDSSGSWSFVTSSNISFHLKKAL